MDFLPFFITTAIGLALLGWCIRHTIARLTVWFSHPRTRVDELRATQYWEIAESEACEYVKSFKDKDVSDPGAFAAEVQDAVKFLTERGVLVSEKEDPLYILQLVITIKVASILIICNGDRSRYTNYVTYYTPAYDLLVFLMAVTEKDATHCAELVKLYMRDPLAPLIDLKGRTYHGVNDPGEEIDDELVIQVLKQYAYNGTYVFHIVDDKKMSYEARMARVTELTGLTADGYHDEERKLKILFRRQRDTAPPDAEIVLVQGPTNTGWIETLPVRCTVYVVGDKKTSCVNMKYFRNREHIDQAFSGQSVQYVGPKITRKVPIPAKQCHGKRFEEACIEVASKFLGHIPARFASLGQAIRLAVGNAQDQITRLDTRSVRNGGGAAIAPAT